MIKVRGHPAARSEAVWPQDGCPRMPRVFDGQRNDTEIYTSLRCLEWPAYSQVEKEKSGGLKSRNG